MRIGGSPNNSATGGLGAPVGDYAQCDVLIIGAGITGLTLARELAGRRVGRVIVIEKESAPGAHASGRNSGVLHAGIYYSPDSLKGRFCVEGNRQLKAFCRARGLSLIESGKVIVARNESECTRLEDLKRRADACGAGARLIEPRELARLEPHAITHRMALHSPETAVVDPLEIFWRPAGGTARQRPRDRGVRLCLPGIRSQTAKLAPREARSATRF